MYPFKNGLTYPRNQWYIGAWSSEITSTPFERTILGEPVAFYRTESGQPRAVAGRCPHRRYPLARGRVSGDTLQCAYHGWTFDGRGACVLIPSQENYVPAGFHVRSYPLVEKWQWVWVWTGDPALADESLIPDHRALQLEGSSWQADPGGLEPLRARYQLMSENVLDLTHVTFVHAATIGTPTIAAAPIVVEERGRVLHSHRLVTGESPTAFHRSVLGLPDRVDRELVTDFYPPTLLASGSRFFFPGEGHKPDGKLFGEFRVFHVATPETATTSHYFWGFTRSFGQGDAALTSALRTGWRAGVLEDVDAMEANEAMIDRGPEMHDLSAKADAGGLRGRKIVEAMMLAERASVHRGAAVDEERLPGHEVALA
jgi:phenylpropionate dioxygenase-like ring-hydroxylating dioxygenase large terminal subunit